jgi:hypothetical protein
MKFKEKLESDKRVGMARMMVAQWTVANLRDRKPDELVRAFGVTLEQAERILKEERNTRDRRRPL